MVSEDVKLHWSSEERRVQEMCKSQGGRPGLPVPNKPDASCGNKATLKRVEKSA